jgi:peptidoglycan/xylan/chitin deacetylase (PgdA/CDA1 family)
MTSANKKLLGVFTGILLLVFPSFHVLAGSVAPATRGTIPVQTKEVALTFDDGPNGTSTLEILKILQKEKVTATFFVMGENVEKYPDITKLIVADGFAIGNHTYDHPKNLTSMTNAQIISEFSKTDAAIASTTGVHTKLFRPPYGRINARVRKILTVHGYHVVLWNVDPVDWNYPSSTSALIVKRVSFQEKVDSTIVMHDGRDTQINYPRGNIIQALPIVIQNLKKQGYAFVVAD